MDRVIAILISLAIIAIGIHLVTWDFALLRIGGVIAIIFGILAVAYFSGMGENKGKPGDRSQRPRKNRIVKGESLHA